MSERISPDDALRTYVRLRLSPSIQQLAVWADSVTALIIERDALRLQVEELLAQREEFRELEAGFPF